MPNSQNRPLTLALLLLALAARPALPAVAEGEKPVPVRQTDLGRLGGGASQDADALSVYWLPKGSAFSVLLQTPLHTAYNQPGDIVEAAVSQDVYLGRVLLVSRNTRLKGHIETIEPPFSGRNAVMTIRFDELQLANGETLPIQAHIRTGRPDHAWGGELTPGTKPRRVTHRVMGIGDYNQVVMGGPRAMGMPLIFKPGEHWTVILEQPVSLVLPRS